MATSGARDTVVCEDARKMLEQEIAELEKKLQLYQLLLAMIEAQCGQQSRGRAKTIVIDYEASDGTTTARILITEGVVRMVMLKPLPRTSPYTKYLLRVVRQLEEESPEVTVSEEGGQDSLRSIVVKGLSRDQVEDLLLAAEYVFRKLGFRRRESKRAEQPPSL